MQPSRLTTPLYITKGATFRQHFFLQQPVVEARAITGGQAQPLEVTVPGHGLSDAWPIWIEGSGIPALERPYPRQPIAAEVVDPDTLRFPGVVVGPGQRPRQGQILFNKPVDLTGASVRLELDAPEGTVPDSIAAQVGEAGVITVEIAADATALITWDRAKFKLWLTMTNGDVDCWLCGEFVAGGAADEFWTTTFGGAGSAGTGRRHRFLRRPGPCWRPGAYRPCWRSSDQHRGWRDRQRPAAGVRAGRPGVRAHFDGP